MTLNQKYQSVRKVTAVDRFLGHLTSLQGEFYSVIRGASRLEMFSAFLLILAVLARFSARPHAPLWIDEAATGAIVSQPTFKLFWQEMRWGLSSPFYLVFMRGWCELFGISDYSLRFPSLVFSITTPLLIVFSRIPSMYREDKLVWAAMLALWVPGIGYAQDARYYALLLFLSTLQVILFVRLLDRTSLSNATLWCACASLSILTHYHAAVLAAVQGGVYLGLRGRAALKTWPAALSFVPAFGAILW